MQCSLAQSELSTQNFPATSGRTKSAPHRRVKHIVQFAIFHNLGYANSMNVIQQPSPAPHATSPASSGDTVSARRRIAASPGSARPACHRSASRALPLPLNRAEPGTIRDGSALNHIIRNVPHSNYIKRSGSVRIGQTHPRYARGTPPRQDCFNSKSPPAKIRTIFILSTGH